MGCVPNPVSLGHDDISGSATLQDGGPTDAEVPLSDVDLELRPYGGACPVSFQWDVPRFEVAVRNTGSVPSGEVLVQLVACFERCSAQDPRQVLFETRLAAGVLPGEQHRIIEPMPALPQAPVGSWQLYFVVDPDDRVNETNETNNQSQFYLHNNGLRALPSTFDFGPVCVGASSTERVVLQNIGATDALIEQSSAIRASRETSFQVPQLPVSLPPGASLSLSAAYAPVDLGADRHFLLLHTDQSSCPLVVEASGEGVTGEVQVERLTQLPGPSIDVLVVLNDSSSMLDNSSRLHANLPSLYDNLVDEGVDFQLGLITASMDAGGSAGRLVGSPAFLTPATADGAVLWADRINVGAAATGLDQGLEVSRLSLSPPLSESHNLGFLRDDASLLLIYVSDQNDTSASPASSYLSFFQGLEADASKLRVNVITTSLGSNCGPAAQRYLELANQTGGRVQEICGLVWTPALSDFARSGFGLERSFQLAASAGLAQQTLVVRVNGVLAPASDYRFDAATRVLEFRDEATPPSGATIEVEYRAACF